MSYFGTFGGMFVPELLAPALEQLARAFEEAQADPAFARELQSLLADYAGRPTPLYACRNLCVDSPSTILLKREDLLHGGAHKTNQVLGQALLARRMGKSRLIAETGAGQHGVATAIVGALFGLPTRIYMGAEDVERQRPNVFRMEQLGAEVVAVETGSRTLKDACNEALRDWAASYPTTHYLLGTAAGPHPFPTMVRELQRVIGKEARAQCLERYGRLPDACLACVGGGSNAIGLFADFVDDEGVALVGVEAAGRGLETGAHAATLACGTPGSLHGAATLVLQSADRQVAATHSISAGLDYPGVGPEHAHLQAIGRATYESATDAEALAAFRALARSEGILPALESAHALAAAIRRAQSASGPELLLVNLSGRGDKDVPRLAAMTASGELAALADEGAVRLGLRGGAPMVVGRPAVVVAEPAPVGPPATGVRGEAAYARMFERLDGRGALVPFVVLGDPTPERTLDVVDALVAGGADALELGIPFSDPVADGPTVQAGVRRALEAGTTPTRCWELLAAVRARHPEVPVGLLVYANLVDARFYGRAAAAGVDSVLVADVPLAEVAPFREAAVAAGVAPVLIAPADAEPATLDRIAGLTQGYTYVLARKGVTGARDDVALDHGGLLGRLAEAGAPPALIGFGISRPEHVRAALDAGAAGAITGSAVVRRVGAADEGALAEVTAFVRAMKGATEGEPNPV